LCWCAASRILGPAICAALAVKRPKVCSVEQPALVSQPIKEQTTMSKSTTTVAIAAVSMALTAQATSAAEIWLEYHPQTPTIYIKGDIERGDYDVFKRVALSDKRLRKGQV